MRTHVKAGLLMLAIGSTISIVQAHPGHSHHKSSPPAANQQSFVSERTWMASTGVFREKGSFVMARDGLVQIRRGDGSVAHLTETETSRRATVLEVVARTGDRTRKGTVKTSGYVTVGSKHCC